VNEDILDGAPYFNSKKRLQEINWVGRLGGKWCVEAVYPLKRVCSPFDGCSPFNFGFNVLLS